jgi:hypothetical protein
MFVYEVYYRDYKKNSTDLIGALTERRNDPKRQKNLIPSALKWARTIFRGLVADANAIFIIAKTIDLPSPVKNNTAGRVTAFQGP